MQDNITNIENVLAKVDATDRKEGLVAYQNYHDLMKSIADYYRTGFVQTVAAFVSLSPNNDYKGNLKSTATLLYGINAGTPLNKIKTSTYRHCLHRAYDYVVGNKDFLVETKGPKIRNFYCSILAPKDKQYITIDGHMHNIWFGKARNMKAAMVKSGQYDIIANDFKKVARRNGLIPNQLQAMLWFTWKRINRIVYNPQYRLGCSDDFWGLKISPEEIGRYEN